MNKERFHCHQIDMKSLVVYTGDLESRLQPPLKLSAKSHKNRLCNCLLLGP